MEEEGEFVMQLGQNTGENLEISKNGNPCKKTYKCDICSMSFQTRTNLSRHRRSGTHSRVRKLIFVHNF